MHDLNFPGSIEFSNKNLKINPDIPLPIQFAFLFDNMINYLELILLLFIVSTIRCYENWTSPGFVDIYPRPQEALSNSQGLSCPSEL